MDDVSDRGPVAAGDAFDGAGASDDDRSCLRPDRYAFERLSDRMPSVGAVGHPDDTGMGWGLARGVVGEASPLGNRGVSSG